MVPVQITHDDGADAAYVTLGPIGEGAAVEQVVLERPGGRLVLDFDRQGRVLGLEIIGASALAAPELLGGAVRL
jgi:uncharacterized protein YuzE